jgi:hypothetical protein
VPLIARDSWLGVRVGELAVSKADQDAGWGGGLGWQAGTRAVLQLQHGSCQGGERGAMNTSASASTSAPAPPMARHALLRLRTWYTT